MQIMKRILAVVLCSTTVTWAQGNSFDKVRYNGGSVSTNVKPDDWDNKLTVNADAIILALKNGQKVNIEPKQVTSLSYGQEAHRRVGTAIGLAVISLGVGALFALHKTKLHYIGIHYTDKDGKKQGLLLQGDKSNFRAIIVALQGVTGAPVSVSEKERGEIPAGITVQTTKETEEAKTTNTADNKTTESKPVPADSAKGTVNVNSNPAGADVLMDGDFVGNSPASLKMAPGKHTITVKLSGFKDWSREITVQAGSEVQLTANLEK